AGADWQTTFAWGENHKHPGTTLDAFLLESAAKLRRSHTVFGRMERVEKDELADGVFNVHKLSLGYVYDFPPVRHLRAGAGGVGSIHFLPSALRPAYGGGTPLSATL